MVHFPCPSSKDPRVTHEELVAGFYIWCKALGYISTYLAALVRGLVW